MKTFAYCALISVFMLMSPSSSLAQDIEWINQFGTPSLDSTLAVAVSSPSVFVVGGTFGVLPGQASAGGLDALVRKLDFGGNEVWTRQFGTDRSDSAQAVAADNAGVYVGGSTSGTFPGQFRTGGRDAFVRMYDAAGNEKWTRQFGTADYDAILALTSHATGLYAFGVTSGAFPGESNAGDQDAFLAKLDGSGNVLWVREFGSPSFDLATFLGGIAVDGTGVYVAGEVGAALPGQLWVATAGQGEAFVRKYDFDGSEIWTREFATACGASALAVAANDTGVYVTGVTPGDFNDPATCMPPTPEGRDTRGYVRKYDAGGNVSRTRQISGRGPGFLDFAEAIIVDDTGLYVGGIDLGLLAGQSPTQPGSDSSACAHVGVFDQGDTYVRKYAFDGQVIWTRQFGSARQDYIHGIAASEGGAYVAGPTYCAMPGQTSAGDVDAFVAKLTTSPTTTQGQIQLIVGQVETLFDGGTLNEGQADSLAATLGTAIEQCDRGLDPRTQLQEFIDKVTALVDGGALSAEAAAALVDSANAVIGQL